jgi:hypothetical protein
MIKGCHAMAQVVSHGLSSQRPRFAPRSVHVGFVMNKLVMGQVFSKIFGSPCQYLSTMALRIHKTCGVNSRPNGGSSSETLIASPHQHEHDTGSP